MEPGIKNGPARIAVRRGLVRLQVSVGHSNTGIAILLAYSRFRNPQRPAPAAWFAVQSVGSHVAPANHKSDQSSEDPPLSVDLGPRMGLADREREPITRDADRHRQGKGGSYCQEKRQ